MMSLPSIRALCLLAVGLAMPASAQVEVALDPPLPRAGQTASATVRFLQLSPSQVTVFARPVGVQDFTSFAAADQGGGVWTATLPFDVPPQGTEAYVEYVQNGETLTEPLDEPDLFPFRVPTLNLVATSDLPQRALQYNMISVPLELGDDSGLPFSLGSDDPVDIFGDDFGEDGDPSQWRLLRWDPRALRYRDAVENPELFERTRPGRGYWLITSEDGRFDVEGGLSAGVVFDGDAPFASPVSVPLRTGWNQIGNPFLFPIDWDDVERPSGVLDPVAFRSSFVPADAALRPWEGYFVFNPGRDGFLRFRARPVTGGEARRSAPSLLSRAGPGAALLTVTARAGDATDVVHVGLADALPTDRPVQLRKPPAIDNALRLSVRAERADWMRHFQPHSAPVWTLSLVARDDAVLQLAPEGPWPGDVTVRDLDRGVELAVSNGTVTVPAIRGVETRQLELRVGDAEHAPAAAVFGTPWPNPSADAVTLPYTLPVASPVRLSVVDVLGRTVRVLDMGDREAGPHAPVWDGRDTSGASVASGTYLIRLDAGRHSATTTVTRL